MKFILILFLLIPFSFTKAQTLSNLDILYRLTDSSVVKLVNTLPADSKKIYFKSALVNDYLLFQSRVISGIRNSNREIYTVEDSADAIVTYTIENISVKYSDVHRDGFLGDYLVKRDIQLSGNYLMSENGSVKKVDNFVITNSDVINYDDISNAENSSIPFTRGEVPAEPFFSSLLEPVVAIGSAAVAVILFFTVRSK